MRHAAETRYRYDCIMCQLNLMITLLLLAALLGLNVSFLSSSKMGRVISNGYLTGDGSEDDFSQISVPFLSLSLGGAISGEDEVKVSICHNQLSIL